VRDVWYAMCFARCVLCAMCTCWCADGRRGCGVADELYRWKQSVFTMPQPIAFTLASVIDLISDGAIAANVNQSLAEYGASVDASNEELVQSILATHPVPPMPSWCTMRDVDSARAATAAASLKPSRVSSLPLCPPIPTPPADATAARAARRLRRV
jgi:hypothetical protein